MLIDSEGIKLECVNEEKDLGIIFCADLPHLENCCQTVADPEFHNGGGQSRGGVRKKLNFYLKMVDFGAF